MKFAQFLTTRHVVLGCVSAAALATMACANGPGGPTSPGASAVLAAAASENGAGSVTGFFPRRGEIHLRKECPEYTGLAGSFCTITASNLKQIEVGSRVVYATAATPTSPPRSV